MVPDRRTRAGLLVSSFILAWSQVGLSAPPRTASECSRALDQARHDAEAGRLRGARTAYGECAEKSCGGPVSAECRGAMQRMADSVPSIVPVVTGSPGAPRTEVRVSMDGELLAERLDGRSIEVDPGMHELTFTLGTGESHTEQVLILEGQRNRVISVELTPKAAPTSQVGAQLAADGPEPLPAAKPVAATPAEAEQPSSSVLPYVIGGVGVAAVGTSFLLAHWGSDDNRALDACAPNCSQESVDHVSRMYIAADITLVAGVVAIGAATWLYLSGTPSEQAADTAAYRVDVHPIARGGVATLAGAF